MKIKKILAAVTAIALGASLCGCSGVETADSADKPLIITTIFPAYDFARQVFGDTAEVRMLLKPGQESHSYDPSAKDIVEINGCDLFVYNGGESDQWVESVLQAAPDVETFRMTDAVSLLDEEHSEGMQEDDHDHDHADGDEEEYDEHVWTSPDNAAAIVRALGSRAKALFPDSAAELDSNTESYAAQIGKIDGRLKELLDGEERYFIFGDRFPLLYFFKHYGLNYYAAFPGCGSETEPSAQTVTFLLDKLGQPDAVKAVFCIELSGRKLADVLAEDSGLDVVEFHSCHNITADDFAAGETYVSLMERNLQTLEKVLVD
ncbi:MAG TPA: zinc ABC transporter substrate-binding protein [Ruminococcaceae bacterium]|jgi:zinc transport system substrate-binding protein|nr:zinc ABC transporter substrate-binding protein [Oscillospiraceae bacterium]